MHGEKKMHNIVLVSGGFDPIHSGHIKLISEASKYGDVVVLLNSGVDLLLYYSFYQQPYISISDNTLVI